MCTIITFDMAFFMANELDAIDRIYDDNKFNSDGLSLVCIDPTNRNNDLVLKSFDVDAIIDALINFSLRSENPDARIWLHQRFATGIDKHIGTMHAFTDRQGNIVMHNGMFGRGRTEYAVDSFAIPDLVNMSYADEIREALLRMDETFCNIFVIRPTDGTYGVVRMKAGTLFTDNKGNFSSKQTATINTPVDSLYAEDYFISCTTARSVLDDIEAEEDDKYNSLWREYKNLAY